MIEISPNFLNSLHSVCYHVTGTKWGFEMILVSLIFLNILCLQSSSLSQCNEDKILFQFLFSPNFQTSEHLNIETN